MRTTGDGPSMFALIFTRVYPNIYIYHHLHPYVYPMYIYQSVYIHVCIGYVQIMHCLFMYNEVATLIEELTTSRTKRKRKIAARRRDASTVEPCEKVRSTSDVDLL